MKRKELETLAIKGAEVELERLEAQMVPLRLLLERGPRPNGRTERKMSPAARKAISVRMKAVWAAKRAQKEKAPTTTKGRRGL